MTTTMIDILLVEDRVEDAELTIMALKNNNIANNIIWLKDGEDALEYVFAEGKYSERDISKKPKLILLDLKMPKIGGLEVLKKIREDDRVKKIPIIILTTSKEEQDLVKAYDYNVNAYIVKPVEFDKFVEAIKSINLFWVIMNQLPAN